MSGAPRFARIAAVGTATLLLAGCTLDPGPAKAPITDVAAAESSPTPTAGALTPGGEVASARFNGRPGFGVSGSLTVVAGTHSGGFAIFTHELVGPAGAELTLLPYSIDATASCADSGFRFSFGTLESIGTGPLDLPFELTRGDPSYFGSAVLTVHSEADREANGCLATVAASAPIVWTIGPRRPELVAADTGPGANAAGVVETDSAGNALSYTVAAGDTLNGIADRFGITVDDIFYLNPTRVPAPRDPLAYTGEVLNLDAGRR